MRPPPFDIEQHVRRHGAALRQLAVALLGDGNAADDAVQATWLDALRHPPRHTAALGGWFATLLRNVVRGFRRRDRRRLLREQAVAAVRGEHAEDHAIAVAREETVQRLLAALASLDVPYREVVWQRYFEGKAPREIAAASGVPLATVKSRLQRGLGTLRERLGEGADGERGDWRRAFAVAFGLREGAAVASAAAVMTGGVLVATWTKGLVAVVAVAVAAMLWWPRDANVTPLAGTAEPSAVAVAQTAALGSPAAVGEGKLEAVERREVASLPQPVDPKLATIRGRCVDENGQALADCRVSFHGRADSRRKEEWLRDHPLPDWSDPPPCITGADGQFTFSFVPPPPFDYFLYIDKEPCASMHGHWRVIEPGAVVSLGDVVLLAGITIGGRVVDEQGRPCPDAQWQVSRELDPPESGESRMTPMSLLGGPCAPDGTFRTSKRFAAGGHVIWAFDSTRKTETQKLQLVRERPVVDVVIEMPAASGPTIIGWVVDEQGKAVRAARIQVARQLPSAAMAREGKFTLRRRAEDDSAMAVLTVSAEGYETLTSDPIAWGTQDVQLRLRSRGNLILSLVDEHAQPVSDYTVRCVPLRGTGHVGSSSDDKRIRARGPFPEGTAVVPGVSLGTWRLVVEFPAATGWPTRIEDIAVSAAGLHHVVVVRPPGQRPLRVVHRDGTPVVGTRVQLVDHLGMPPAPDTKVMETSPWLLNIGNQAAAVVVFDGTTDAAGRLLVRGPTERPLALRVLGPGHAPFAQERVSLVDAGELVVAVGRGARLVARIVPTDALERLARLAPAGRDGESQRTPRLRLESPAGHAAASTWTAAGTVDAPAFAMAPDGTLSLDGQPAGSWQVFVDCWRATRANGGVMDVLELATVALLDEQETRVDIDMSELLPGDLEAQVVWNGAPFANATVRLEANYPALEGRKGWAMAWFLVPTDADGRLRCTDRPGEFAVRLWSGPDGKDVPRLRAPVAARLVAGRSSSTTFTLDSGTVQVTVHDHAGQPVEGVMLFVKDSDVVFAASDAMGKTMAAVAAGAVVLRVLPKSVQSTAARQQRDLHWLPEDRVDPYAAHWLELGTVVVAAGQTITHEVRLPPAFDK